jgi:hypothetical protein
MAPSSTFRWCVSVAQAGRGLRLLDCCRIAVVLIECNGCLSLQNEAGTDVVQLGPKSVLVIAKLRSFS